MPVKFPRDEDNHGFYQGCRTVRGGLTAPGVSAIIR
jgi:hypothetical protein